MADDADLTAERFCAAAGVRIQMVDGIDEIEAASALIDRIWGLGPGEGPEMQPGLLRALEHAGGYVAVAYADTGPSGADAPGVTDSAGPTRRSPPEMIAASVGFLAAPIGRGLHSHITGVAPGRLSSGIGAALKWHQRAWALSRGLDVITWTYDPLIARNSFFNIARLGALPREYLVDFYGAMPDLLNIGQPSDRAMAVWELRSPRVVDCASRSYRSVDAEELRRGGAHVLLAADPGGYPVQSPGGEAPVCLVQVPADVEQMRRDDVSLALRWRLALRSTLAPMMGDPSWQVVDFLRSGWYVLARNNSDGSTG